MMVPVEIFINEHSQIFNKVNRRLTGDGRDTRLCSCNGGIQTLSHVLFSCPLTVNISQALNVQASNLTEFFDDMDLTKAAIVLKSIEKQLKL